MKQQRWVPLRPCESGLSLDPLGAQRMMQAWVEQQRWGVPLRPCEYGLSLGPLGAQRMMQAWVGRLLLLVHDLLLPCAPLLSAVLTVLRK